MITKRLFLLLFVLFFHYFSAKSANFYWVGGTGSWSNTANWSATPGGPSVGSIPTNADNVIFDLLSGLLGATVTMDVPVTVVNFDFSTAPAFTLAGALASIEIRGSLSSNALATLTYSGAINMFSTAAGSILTSNTRTWANNFVFTGSNGTNGVVLFDNFATTQGISITRGIFNSNSKNITAGTFNSTDGGNRTITLNNSLISINGTTWNVVPAGGPNTLSLTATGSTINLTNTTIVGFSGGGQTYATLASSASSLSISGANSFGATSLATSSTLLLENSINQNFVSLSLNGTCANKAIISPIISNQPAATITISTSPFAGTSINITKVNAVGPTIYNLTSSNLTNATGWTLLNNKYYWINNTGNWNDGNHWATTSGGLASGCIPTQGDSVFFDANSFSLSNQVVTVNSEGYFKAMKWINISQTQTLLLDSVNATNTGTLYAFGDIILHSNVQVRRIEMSCSFVFNAAGKISANSANIDANFRVLMPNNTTTILIDGDLVMSDTSSVLLLQGGLNSQNFKLVTGTFRTLNDPAGTGDTRTLTLGTSSVHIVQTFQADNDPQFTLAAGTSNLYIGDTIQFIPDTISYVNNLLTSNLTFYNVTLNFQPIKIGPAFISQKVKGNNTFNRLRIVPGSRVEFANASNQTVTDTLFMIGTCIDSIRVLSDGAGQFTITKANTKVKAQCIGMEDCNISTAQTAYFSTNITNNTNWTFNTSSPIAASFTSSSPDCFGTATTFTPSSTTLFSESVTYLWQYNDGSTAQITADQYSGFSEDILNYPAITGISKTDTLPVTTWTELTDPSNLFYPALGNGTAYPSPNGTSINLNFDTHFALSLENATGSNAYLVDMNTNYYKVKYKYRPKIIVYKNGAPFTSIFLTSGTFNFQEDTLANGAPKPLSSGSTLLVDTIVNINLNIVNLLPTDKLTFYTSVAVTYDGYPTQPRWKNANNTVAADVAISYKMAYDSIKFIATPLSNNQSGTSHVFEGRGDFNVSLIAINNVNMCTDTVTNTVTINGPVSYLNSNQLDTIICAGDQVIFSASSTGDTTTLFTFLLNGDTIQGPGLIDTLAISSLIDLDTISIRTSNGGCNSLDDPYIQFSVNALPTFSYAISPNDTICQGETVTFTASAVEPGVLYRYKKNASFVNTYSTNGTYTSSTLVNNDLISMYVKSPTTGCIADSIVPITVNPLPTVTLTENSGDFLICSGDAVLFTAGGAGIGGQYEFFINGVSQGITASTTFTTTGLINGNIVSVKGYTAAGCGKLSTTTFSYTVITTPTTSISFNPGSTVCSGTNVNVVASGAALYEFYLNGVSQGAPSTVSSISSASYLSGTTFYVVGSNSGCPATSSTITLTVNPSPTTSLLGPATVCSGSTANYTASGASTYQFQINGVAQGPFSATATFSSSTLSNGNVITVIGQANGCFVSSQITVTVNAVPNVQLFSSDADNTICSTDAITFTGANASSYELFVNGSSVATSTSPFVNPVLNLGSNTIYVIGTAVNSCVNQSNTITTTVNPTPVMSISSSDLDNIICAGQAVTFTGSGSNQYQFFVNGSPQSSLSTTNTFTSSTLTNGQSITVLGNSLGCTSTSSAITMTVNPVPSMSLTSTDGDNSFCQGDNVTFTGLGAGAGTYEFFVNSVSQGAPSGTNTINSLGFTAGNYPVSVTGVLGGCSSTSTIVVTVNTLPIAGLTSNDADNVICFGDQITYSGSGGNVYQFFINGTSQGSPSALSTFVNSSLINNDIVSVNVINGAGCMASTSFAPITVNPVPVTTLTSSDADNQICVNDNVTFTGSGATVYEFFVGGFSQGAPSATSTFTTNSLTNGQSVMVVGSSLGCPDNSNSINTVVFGPPTVQLINNGTSVICVGENTNLLATGATNYQFTVNGSPIGVFSPTSTFTSPVNNGDVISVIGQSNGCSNTSSDNYTFTVNTYPTISSSSSDPDNTICLNELVTFSTSGASSYEFDINGVQAQSGVSGSFSTNDLINGDIVSVTGYNGNCASTSNTYTFVVNSLPLNLTISPSSLICTGETVTFTASGAEQFEFFLNGSSQGSMSTTNSLTLAPLDQDEITYTGFSSLTGCTQLLGDYILINVMDQPLISNTTSLTICEGDSVILYSNSISGNQWYLNGSAILGATDTSYVAFVSGDYSLETTAGGIGTIQSFGYNAQGTFGDGTNFNNPDPTATVPTVQFDEISSGYEFVLGVSTTGTVYSWGDNSSGQLGNGTYTSSNIPLAVPTVSNVKTVATSSSSSMAITNTGTVYVWGNNSVGQLGTGNTSVINFPFLNGNLTNIDTVAAGKSHFVFLKNDGTVWTVGSNSFGQLGQGNLNSSMLPVQISSLSNIVSIGAGEYHSFAINNLGDLYVWGNNGSGQLGLNDLNSRINPEMSTLRNITNAQGGAAHSIFLSNTKKVYTSGSNTYGQLGTGDFINHLTPTETALSGVDMISAGEFTSLVKRQDNSVFGFGSNIEQQLSSLNGNSINTPEYIEDLDGVTFIEAGRFSSHFINNESNSCASANSSVNVIPVPIVTVTSAAGILTATAGVSYQWYFNGAIINGANSQTWTPLTSGNYSVEVTFANGCTGMSANYLIGFAGLNEMNSTFEVYPNPTNGVVHVQSSTILNEEIRIIVRDMAGRIVIEHTNSESDSFTLDFSNLNNGVYIIELVSNNVILGRKQIVRSN